MKTSYRWKDIEGHILVHYEGYRGKKENSLSSYTLKDSGTHNTITFKHLGEKKKFYFLLDNEEDMIQLDSYLKKHSNYNSKINYKKNHRWILPPS